MIKGVNRKVIEINRPDSAYFERAVLYLRPEVTDAELLAAQTETLERLAVPRHRHTAWAAFLLGAAVSAAVCWALAVWLG